MLQTPTAKTGKAALQSKLVAARVAGGMIHTDKLRQDSGEDGHPASTKNQIERKDSVAYEYTAEFRAKAMDKEL